jgi:pentatricopeptide repeat protein
VGTTLVDMYVKYASRVFNEMIEQDVVLSNAMIVGYTNSGRIYEALQLFQKMSPKGRCVMELMIAGYAQKVQFDESLEFFHQIPQ